MRLPSTHKEKFVEVLPTDKGACIHINGCKGYEHDQRILRIERSLEELDSEEKPKQRQERLNLALDAVSHGLKQLTHHREQS